MDTPTFIEPMAARLVTQLPEGEGWAYEVKLDGYRALILKRGESVQIRSRNNKDLTRAYPSVAAAALRLRAHAAAIDGEVVAVDAAGHLRHAVFLGIRDDKAPKDVRRDS